MPFRTSVVLSLLLTLVFGCAGTAQRQTSAAIRNLQLTPEDTVMVFGRKPRVSQLDEEQLQLHIERQISRLTGPAWKEGWQELTRLGLPAVEKLVPLVESAELTHVTRSPRPGVINLEEEAMLTLGEVVYSLLREMVSLYGDYSGEFPPRNVKAWSTWWNKKGRRMLMNAEVVAGSGKRR